jgi:uncharacterized protein YuzE
MESQVRITFDPDANAIYVKTASLDAPVGETTVDDNGVIIDTDSEGNARGFEFLAVRNHPILLDALPTDVAAALGEFLSSGALESTIWVESEF